MCQDQCSSSGVRVSRRGLLIVGAGACVAGQAAVVWADDEPSDYQKYLRDAPVEFAPLLPATTPAAQNAYIAASAARALQVSEFPRGQLTPALSVFSDGRLNPVADAVRGLEIGNIARTKIFLLTEYRAAPRVHYPPHNHPNYSVATIMLEGEARVRFFEPAGTTPPFESKEHFRVRRTEERMLRPGQAATLTPDYNNIHAFDVADKGARWIDVTSRHGKDVGFAFLTISNRRGTRVGDTQEARWGL